MDVPKPGGWWAVDPYPVSLRCPGCGQVGTFQGRGDNRDTLDHGDMQRGFFGMRMCPNPKCGSLIYVAGRTGNDGNAEVLATYPPEVIDFDATGLPDGVRTALEESIRCHAAESYRAAAVMVRRTVEEACDEQKVDGDNLYHRIEALRERASLPVALIEGLHDLRLLGNDAVHVDLRDFDNVGEVEASLAVDIAKRFLEALYQNEAILGRLSALRKQREASS